MNNNEDIELKKSILTTNLLNSINSNYKLCIIFVDDLVYICNEAKKKDLILPVAIIDTYLNELDLIEKDFKKIKPNDFVDDNKINVYYKLNNKICSLNNSILTLINDYINQLINYAKDNNIVLNAQIINVMSNYGINNNISKNNKSKR